MSALPWIAGAAVLGIGGYFLWPDGEGKHKHHGKPGDDPNAAQSQDTTAQPPDQGPGNTAEAPEQSAEVSTTPADVPNSPAPATPANSGFHPGPYLLPAAVSALATNGRAALAARTLYAQLGQYGVPAVFEPSVLAFQRMHNTDSLAIRLAGRLPRTGVYDARTSAVLTMYTGRPIPAHASAPPPPPPHFGHVINPNVPGNAALAGWNLGVDFNRRGMVHDGAQRALIREYQRAINRDPKFPGRAWARGTKPLFNKRIKENGRYNADTARALAIQTRHAPPPPAA